MMSNIQKDAVQSRRYLNVEELSDYSGLSKWTIYALVSQRKIPFIPLGRFVRFDVLAINKWMQDKLVRSVNDG